MSHRYLNANEAAAELGVSLPTLYAYVSRGLIRSEQTPDDNKRARRYYAEDVQKLKERKESRRNPEKLTEGALHWGTPIMESAITLIADGRLYYRGYDVQELALTHSVEQVAALIWTGDFDTADTLFATAPPVPPLAEIWNRLTPIERFAAALPLAAHEDFAAYDLRPAAVTQTGARILQLLAALASGENPTSGIVDTLRRGWLPDHPEAAPLLNAALILCADHELNVSSFAARVVASAGSTPYAVVSAGLAAMQGIKHGGHTERVEAFLHEVSIPSAHSDVRQTLAARLRRGEPISGFGHQLYPDGDPRANLLLQMTADIYPDSPAVALAQSIMNEAFNLIGEPPTVDFALATMARALGFAPGRALALFAIGRTIGWIGHAIEQYESDSLIRPRARYVGRQPNGVQS